MKRLLLRLKDESKSFSTSILSCRTLQQRTSYILGSTLSDTNWMRTMCLAYSIVLLTKSITITNLVTLNNFSYRIQSSMKIILFCNQLLRFKWGNKVRCILKSIFSSDFTLTHWFSSIHAVDLFHLKPMCWRLDNFDGILINWKQLEMAKCSNIDVKSNCII